MLIAMAWKIVGECAPDALRHLQVAGRSRSGALIVCCDGDDADWGDGDVASVAAVSVFFFFFFFGSVPAVVMDALGMMR
jgi:hypothetical protein